MEGARRLLRQQEGEDRELKERLERLREQLRRQARRRVAHLVEDYDHRVDELTAVSRKSDEEVAREIAALEERLRTARSVDWSKLPPPDLLEEVRAALLLPSASWNQPAKRPGVFARLRAAFARFFAWLRRLFSRSKAPTPSARPEGRPMPLAFAATDGRAIGASEIGEALARLTPAERNELTENVTGSITRQERSLEREA